MTGSAPVPAPAMGPVSESRLVLINPRLAALTRQLAAQLRSATDHTLAVTQGLRGWNEQLTLWAKGRVQEDDGSWTETDPAAIVTNAPPGHSWHEFGLAVDVAPSQFGPDQPYSPDWNVAHPIWPLLVHLGLGLGLVSGSCFHHPVDNPHFQLTGKFPVSPDGEVRQIFKDAGMVAVWQEAGLG